MLVGGDLDGNRVTELYSVAGGEIKPFRLTAGEKTSGGFYRNWKVFEEDGERRLLTNPGQAHIKDAAGNMLKKVLKPSTQYAYLFEKGKPPLAVFIGGGRIGLFDLDGRLRDIYEAPLSEEEYGFLDNRERFDGDLKVGVFQAEAFRLKLQANQPAWTAVLVHQSRESLAFTAMLYIYDAGGKLVYQELFDDPPVSLTPAPAASGDGTENLLVTAGDRIRKYTGR